MTVKQLIKELKKVDQNAEVGFRDHDSDEYTVSSWVHGALELNYDQIPQGRESENIWNITGTIVIIH